MLSWCLAANTSVFSARRLRARRTSGSTPSSSEIHGDAEPISTGAEVEDMARELNARTSGLELSNEHLAHELSLNQSYRIPDHRAVWPSAA